MLSIHLTYSLIIKTLVVMLLISLVCARELPKYKVEIYDKPGKPRKTSGGYGSGIQKRDISPLSGPKMMYFLDGECLSDVIEQHEYSICLFRNVTQQRLSASKPNLIGLIEIYEI